MEEFKSYLAAQGYKDGTVLDYYLRIERLIRTQKYTWESLTKNIATILPEYERGGEKQSLGKRSHNSVRCSLRNLLNFTKTFETAKI